MHTLFAAPSALPSQWLFGISRVLIGGALLPFLLSVLLDALALGIQRQRWRLLVGLLAVVAATNGALTWTLSLAGTARSAYDVDWPQLVELLFGVGMVVALWHGIPRVMRSVLRRRREDRERLALEQAADAVWGADEAPDQAAAPADAGAALAAAPTTFDAGSDNDPVTVPAAIAAPQDTLVLAD